MNTTDTRDITQLLGRWREGDRSVENDLLNSVYPVLQKLAQIQIRQHGGALTLQATELANEAYEKLHLQQGVDWHNRKHFYAIAATVVRRVVIDYLRSRGSEKRGGATAIIAMDEMGENETPTIDDAVDWLALDRVLGEFEIEDPDCARVVELKFFSGLTTEQIADVCGSSVATVGRQWRYARAWLAERLDADTVI
ncbi:MAG: ECF-type sigma factor [Tahibacter sp.]